MPELPEVETLRQDLAREVNLLTSNAEQFRALMGRVEASPELVRLAGTERMSTQTMVRAEAILAATVDAMAQDASHPLDRNGLRLRAKADGLSPAQMAALTHITGDAAVSCLTGVAGAGKSYTLGVARKVWEASGYTVRGAALSGNAKTSWTPICSRSNTAASRIARPSRYMPCAGDPGSRPRPVAVMNS